MSRNTRPVIAINQEDNTHRIFQGITSCAHELGVSTTAVLIAITRNTSVKGWKLYDTPENIRKRVSELMGQIHYLEKIMK